MLFGCLLPVFTPPKEKVDHHSPALCRAATEKKPSKIRKLKARHHVAFPLIPRHLDARQVPKLSLVLHSDFRDNQPAGIVCNPKGYPGEYRHDGFKPD
jgi:hypothetical protein